MTQHRSVIPGGPGPWAGINAAAIAHNLAWVKRFVQDDCVADAPAPRLWAVIKADAYGHGVAHVIASLEAADGLCVSDIGGVVAARRQGWSKPIMMLSAWGLSATDLCDPQLGELHVVVDTPQAVSVLEHASPVLPHVHAWLRHAGYLRSHGFAGAEYSAAFKRLHARMLAGALGGVGHLHHYAMAENAKALALEDKAFIAAAGGLPGPHCTGNSASLCGPVSIAPHGEGHWLRCGLALYGVSALPDTTGLQLGLRPAMSLRARLLDVKHIDAGETVGYGGSYRAPNDTCIGVVGIGYAHGLPRRLWEHGTVLVGRHDRRVKLAGKVSMESMTIDLGPEPLESRGDIVTLWGHSPAGAYLPVEEVAASCGTIAAELLTSLTRRVPLVQE